MRIVAVGGGEIRSGETMPLEQRLLELTGKSNPSVLFIPTASMDSEDYQQAVAEHFGDRLGCAVKNLLLCQECASSDEARELIDWADAVYVGGGNTKAMLERWRELGVDRILIDAAQGGKPVGGVSAGAICWFRVGNSDWPQYECIPGLMTARLDCLGLVDLVLCPHASAEPFRLPDFSDMMKGETGTGVALDDCCAIEIYGSAYRFLGAKAGVCAHVFKRGSEPHRVKPFQEFRPLQELTEQ